jgi:hypothetical protein
MVTARKPAAKQQADEETQEDAEYTTLVSPIDGKSTTVPKAIVAALLDSGYTRAKK